MSLVRSASNWTVGGRLREERERLGFTPAGLARTAGIRSAVQERWERNEDWPHVVELAAYARAGVDILYIITGLRTWAVPDGSSNAVDALRERTGSVSDSALARQLGVSPSTVNRWRKLNRVPERATRLPSRGPAYTPAEIRRGIALLSPAIRRALVLELMSGELGG